MAAEKELLQGIEALREGKEEGFNILYSYTYNFVYRRAKMFTDTEEDALDLTQETYIQAYKGIQKLENPQNIYAWLGKIVYYQGAKKYHKTEHETLVHEESEGIFEDIESEDKTLRPEEKTELEETANIIKEMIHELPELQRSAIMAFYYDNMKIDEIAEVFGCSSNTIKSRLNYAKKALKEKVETHEKANRYKLHSLTPAVFYLACKSLFAKGDYMLATEMAQMIYNGACNTNGLEAKEIVAQNAWTEAEHTGVIHSSTGAATGEIAGAMEAGIGTVVAKTGLSVGVKCVFGALAAVMIGAGGVGVAAVTGNFNLQNVFQQETVRQDQMGSEETENSEETEIYEKSEVFETTETTEVAFESYADVVTFMQIPEYIVEEAAYSEEAVSLVQKLISTMMLEKNQSFDMVEMNDEQRRKLNYNLLNGGFGYGFIPETTDSVPSEYVGICYDTEVLNAYFGAFYEGGNVGVLSNALYSPDEQYTLYLPSDAGESYTFFSNGKLRYTMYQYGEYLLFEAPCYQVSEEWTSSIVEYHASVLFKITENELYPIQMVHVNTFDKVLDAAILIKEKSYICDTQNQWYSLSITNIRDYGTYQKFDMTLRIENTQDMERSIDYKRIICFDVIFDGAVATFESEQEWFNLDSGFSHEEIEIHNGFYGTFTVQEDGSLLLNYDVKDDSDGWNLNRAIEPITLK